MSELTAELADPALEACKTNAGEIAEALGRVFDAKAGR